VKNLAALESFSFCQNIALNASWNGEINTNVSIPLMFDARLKSPTSSGLPMKPNMNLFTLFSNVETTPVSIKGKVNASSSLR